MEPQKKKNPATAFLIMAGFNILAAISFLVFYFLSRGAGADQAYYLLIAAGVSIIAAAGLLGAYAFFKKKLQQL